MSAAMPSAMHLPPRSASGRRAPGAILRIAATALAGGFLCATMVRFSPGFGVDENQLDPRLSRQSREALERSHDGERNVFAFYVSYLKHAFAGDLGTSPSLDQPIASLIAQRAPVTARLMAYGISGAWLLAMALVVPPMLWRLPALGAIFTVMSAIVLFRVGGSAQATIALILFPKLYYYLRNLLRQSYGMPHVLLARAKGLGRNRILLRHVLPVAGPQLIALAAVSVNLAFGAAIAVEAICDLPGIGQLAWKAALARDLPVLVVVTVMVTVLTQVSNLAADFCMPARSRA